MEQALDWLVSGKVFPLYIVQYSKLLILSLFGLVLMACQNETRSYKVLIIVPEGYMGAIRMIFDTDDGLPVKEVDGVRVFRVTQEGVVRSCAENPFLKWGEGLVVRDEMDRTIPVAVPRADAEPERIMFRPIGGPADSSEFWAVIGTEVDYLNVAWEFRNPGTKRSE